MSCKDLHHLQKMSQLHMKWLLQRHNKSLLHKLYNFLQLELIMMMSFHLHKQLDLKSLINNRSL